MGVLVISMRRKMCMVIYWTSLLFNNVKNGLFISL